VLTLVGTRIDRLAIRRVAARPSSDGPWASLARWVMRRPVAVLVPTLAVILVLGSPFLHVRFNAPDSSILPPSVPSRAAFDRLRAEFGEGEFAPIVLAIRTTGRDVRRTWQPPATHAAWRRPACQAASLVDRPALTLASTAPLRRPGPAIGMSRPASPRPPVTT
jgi:uncharacterized membrane protein YdfJ with MMPL/SSD domain